MPLVGCYSLPKGAIGAGRREGAEISQGKSRRAPCVATCQAPAAVVPAALPYTLSATGTDITSPMYNIAILICNIPTIAGLVCESCNVMIRPLAQAFAYSSAHIEGTYINTEIPLQKHVYTVPFEHFLRALLYHLSAYAKFVCELLKYLNSI